MKAAFVLLIHLMVTLTLAAENAAVIEKNTNTAEKNEAILTAGSTGSLEDKMKTAEQLHRRQYDTQTYHYPRYRYPQHYRQPVANGYYNRYPQRVYYYANRYPYRPYNRPSSPVYYNRPSSYSEFSSNYSGSFSGFGGHHAGGNHASHGHFGFGHGDAGGGHGHDSYGDHSSHGGHSSSDSYVTVYAENHL